MENTISHPLIEVLPGSELSKANTDFPNTPTSKSIYIHILITIVIIIITQWEDNENTMKSNAFLL